MTSAAKLSLHDHALIHALHVLTLAPWDMTEGEQQLVLSILRDVLDSVDRRNPLMAPLADQADRLLRTRGPIMSLQHEIGAACHQFNRLRLAAAWANINGEG